MDKLNEGLRNQGMIYGRMISSSKSLYRQENPGNEVYFNANLFTKRGKQWYGDLDITKDSEKLQAVADFCGEELLVLREMDGRFENEERAFDDAKKVAVKIFTPKLELFND